jgi:hypothetical protein
MAAASPTLVRRTPCSAQCVQRQTSGLGDVVLSATHLDPSRLNGSGERQQLVRGDDDRAAGHDVGRYGTEAV